MPVSISQYVCDKDYEKLFTAIFAKPCRIIDYCYGKNLLNFGVDPTQSGGLAAIMDF